MKYEYKLFVGERALFASHGISLSDCIFADGESPLKESSDLSLDGCIFKWKYPLWYCKDVRVQNTSLLESARSGIWYTDSIEMKNCLIEAPKTFRRASNITLTDCNMPKAQETLWSCDGVKLCGVSAVGDYFGMNSKNVVAKNFTLSGNYAFDGGENIVIENAKLLSKDAFWNSKNVTVRNSVIIGEYLGWNSENLTFENCTVDSDQGLCYVKGLTMKNCKFLNTGLAFEYSGVDVEAISPIDSIKNPTEGRISAPQIGEIIMEENRVDTSKTEILIEK